MSQSITKTDFVRYTQCPLYAWFWKNRPDLREGYQNSRIADQGYEVEKLAYKLFDGQDVDFQAEVKTDKYLARADILKRDATGIHIFEVKSSTKKKTEHVPDLCFQLNAFRDAGFDIASVNLILVNSDYVFDEKVGMEVDKFLKIEDLTEEIFKKADGFRLEMEQAHKVLTDEKEPSVAALKKTFKYPLPPKFSEYYWEGIPEFSIYDISNIRKNKLEALASRDILTIRDVPDDFDLSDSQKLQVQLTKGETNIVDRDAIKNELESLEYPLYFLDYETINPAIPFLDKQKPHQQVVFQYSLHILDEPGGEMRHVEFLHTERTNPIPHILAKLNENIGDKGSILVWYEPFEKGRNKEMAETCPEYQEFMEAVNDRVYDLMLIFKDKYVDYRFKGSMSIKNVLPILVPELDYKDLDIQHGGMAMDAIADLIEGKAEDPNILAKGLKKYCEQDTLAMVKIFEVLTSL